MGAEPVANLGSEGGLLRRVRLQLALWSGGVTLVLLLLLGGALYIAVDRSLSNTGTAELVRQANALTGGQPGPNEFPDVGFIFGGPGSGTLTMLVDSQGLPVRRLSPPVPSGLPSRRGR